MPLNLTRHLHLRSFPSFGTILVVSTVLRVGLILYSEWHDAHAIVKYTDIDYRVFSDAARFVLRPSDGNRAQGPLGEWLGLGDPYTRATYRYTPLLALLLAPNEWIHPSFGKYLFAACDIVAGVLIYELLVHVILPATERPPPEEPAGAHVAQSADGSAQRAQDAAKPGTTTHEGAQHAIARRAALLASTHLLNPLVFSISTRGSSEAVLALAVLLTLFCAARGRWGAAAALLGLSAHWKIYPFVYGVACVGVIARERGAGKGWRGYVRGLASWRVVRFGLLSAGTFGVLGAAMYAIWGHPFLHESYLYHLHRLDHRHNFAPYFYPIYLSYPTHPQVAETGALPWWRAALRSPLAGFAPQMALALGGGVLFGARRRDLPFAWSVQTYVFVLLNKVCTFQYFLWYTLFVPLLVPQLDMTPRRALQLAGVWVGTQALWLSEAYKLEFLGENVFFGLWVRSIIYLFGHAWVLAGIMQCYEG